MRKQFDPALVVLLLIMIGYVVYHYSTTGVQSSDQGSGSASSSFQTTSVDISPNGNLTRELAKKLLNDRLSKFVVVMGVLTGRVSGNILYPDIHQYNDILERLIAKNIISRKNCTSAYIETTCDVSVTEEGTKYLAKYSTPGGYLLPFAVLRDPEQCVKNFPCEEKALSLGNISVQNITGITDMPIPGMKQADYSYNIESTPITAYSGLDLRSSLTAAIFRRYDDGWRLVEGPLTRP